MKRGKSADMLAERDPSQRQRSAWEDEGVAPHMEGDDENGLETPDQDGDIDHERARRLIREQTHRLLPPADANALADHLLTCDACYKFAQDLAAKERKRQSGDLSL
jgi:hypothetical protein